MGAATEKTERQRDRRKLGEGGTQRVRAEDLRADRGIYRWVNSSKGCSGPGERMGY